MATQLSKRPEHRDLLGHHCEPDPNVKHGWRVTFDYPDCTRTFDGSQWTVTPNPKAPNLFDTPAGGWGQVEAVVA